jgi:murein DD-endopeptidase MepM/ murein hydrolase activator NlpD
MKKPKPVLFPLLTLIILFTLIVPLGLYPDTLRLRTDSVAAMVLGGPPFCRVAEDARFRWENGELKPIEGLFSFYATDQQPLDARFQVIPSASRGEALRGYFWFSEPVDRLDATLRGSDGEVVGSARGFAVDDSERQWCFLLGIASTAESGQYSLELRAYEGRRYILYRTAVQIRYRGFRSEEIAFNQALSELLTEPDPGKIQEYRELLALLKASNARSVYHIGTLVVPVDATRRTSGFADRRLYSFSDGGSSRSLHNGIDLAAPVGTPIFASGAGRVVLARQRIISGNSVVIEHLPGVYTLYYHLDDLEVEEGQRLHQGQRIGTVGMTGLATGPHLHWELRVGGVAVDPNVFVAAPMIDKTVFSHNIMGQN